MASDPNSITGPLIDPRPPPKHATKPRTVALLACDICGRGFVPRSGNANQFCSYACARLGFAHRIARSAATSGP
jgi:hypothetical protein